MRTVSVFSTSLTALPFSLGLAVAQPSAVVVPFELVGDHILIRAVVDGRPAELILDTGSGSTTLDAAFAAQLSLESLGRVAVSGTGAIEASMARARSIRIGGTEMRDESVVLLPFAPVSKAHGRPIHGTIGYGFFARHVVELDYAKRTLRLHDTATFEYRGTGIVLPVDLSMRIPVTTVSVTPRGGAPIPARLAIDLGSSSLAIRLSEPWSRKHNAALAAGPTIDAPLGVGIGGMSMGRITRLGEVRVGELRVRDPVAGLATGAEGFLGAAWADGTLGAPVFERTTMIIDYARARIILEPKPGFDAPFAFNRTGLFLLTDGEGARFDRVVVRYVVAGSPAADAGIRAGDELVSFDGVRASAETVPAIRRKLSEQAPTRRITVRRGSATLTVEIRPRELL